MPSSYGHHNAVGQSPTALMERAAVSSPRAVGSLQDAVLPTDVTMRPDLGAPGAEGRGMLLRLSPSYGADGLEQPQRALRAVLWQKSSLHWEHLVHSSQTPRQPQAQAIQQDFLRFVGGCDASQAYSPSRASRLTTGRQDHVAALDLRKLGQHRPRRIAQA